MNLKNRLHPIIYVRGYAGSESAVEETVATPYMGFNLGATKARQRWDGEIVRHVFESPLVRLMKDYGYQDIYSHGEVIAEDDQLPSESVIIFRYYDQVSKDLGTGDRPEIEVYAKGLDALIDRVRKQVCEIPGPIPRVAQKDFRVFLVAHSMGGLICRAFLQNFGKKENKACVDKVFTYATPHNGIDIKVIGNLPGFFSMNNADNFNRERMKEYLKLPTNAKRADSLNGKFDTNRFFSLVGTNAKDYGAGSGWSTRAVGQISDGLVRVDNAAVQRTPRAFVHRSHSGNYGIVNSEEGYQNLTRFLFGDVRVDGKLKIDELSLPLAVQKKYDDDMTIRASYYFETVVRPRGARYDLHRRTVAENSAIFRKFDELFPPKPRKSHLFKPRHPHLFSIYLAARHRTKGRGPGPLVFAMDLAVKVPEYEIERRLWLNDHIEGSDLYRETILIAAVPPKAEGEQWEIRYGFNAFHKNPTPRKAKMVDTKSTDGALTFAIPVESKGRPGIKAMLELTARRWE